MKRFFSLILACVFVLTATVFAATSVSAADGKLVMEMTNASGTPDGEITVNLELKNNPGFYCLAFLLYYNSDTFILRECKLGDSFTSVSELWDTNDNQTPDQLNGDVANGFLSSLERYGVDGDYQFMKMVFVESKSLDNVNATGTMLTLTFQVQGIANEGDHTIGIMPDLTGGNMINIDGEDLFLEWTDAKISVGSNAPVPAETEAKKEFSETVEWTEGDSVTSAAEDSPSAEDYGYGSSVSGTIPEGADTYVADDGNIYYDDEEGNTVLYDPAKADESDDDEGVSWFSQHLILIVVIAALIVLVAAAGILYAVLASKKKGSVIPDDNDR